MFRVPGHRNVCFFFHFCSLFSIFLGVQNDPWVIFDEDFLPLKVPWIFNAQMLLMILERLYQLTWILSYYPPLLAAARSYFGHQYEHA